MNSFSFALLEKAETIVGGADAKPQQNLVAYNGSGEEYIEEFASRVSRQKQKVEQIEIYFMTNNQAGEVWFKMIQKCKSWKIEILHIIENTFEDDYNGLLEGLAKESAHGGIRMFRFNDACIAKTKIVHLKRIWNITESMWIADSFWLGIRSWRRDWENWAKMSARIKNIQTMIHNEKCKTLDMCTCVKINMFKTSFKLLIVGL